MPCSIFILVLLLLGASSHLQAQPQVRIGDLTFIYGARNNQLVGYGLVAGLAGDGDKDPEYTVRAVANMLQRHGMSMPPSVVTSKNIAAVMVTAEIPPFVKSGSQIDVTVSAMGDAKSLHGGVLIQTPLIGVDGKVYAIAQGAIAVGGFLLGAGGAGGATVQKNHPTTGQIINGAIVEQSIPVTMVRGDAVELVLREQSFATAARIAESINRAYPSSSRAVDGVTIRVRIPDNYQTAPVDFLAQIQELTAQPQTPARIIINERTGTIVATAQVKISSCAVAQGNITVTIGQTLDVTQPPPFGAGETAIVPRTDVEVIESRNPLGTDQTLFAFAEMPTVERVATSLNALGATSRDIMAIFQAMKQAGALQAELIVR
jgi:flagellar P-ring protein FlgI